jgi:hypothetical protein
MADAKPPEPPEGVAAPLTSPEEVATAWKQFREGVAPCPADGAPLALAVEGTANVYRFVCVKCGSASAWFEAGVGGLTMRGPRATPPAIAD